MELQDATAHLGVYNDTCRDMMCLLTKMLRAPWEGSHTCLGDGATHQCDLCVIGALWHQLAAKCLEFVTPVDEIKLPVKELPRVDEIQQRSMAASVERANGE